MRILQVLILLFITIYSNAQNTAFPILSEKERARVVNDILEDRLDNLLPKLMEREQIDMWILISREYNEDPVMRTILPSTWLSARRRTIMVFNKNKETQQLDKIAIARYSVGTLLRGEWDVDVYPDQWEAVVNITKEKDPESIGLNISETFALADTLGHTVYKPFMANLQKSHHPTVQPAKLYPIA